jgi:hypothetical protein
MLNGANMAEKRTWWGKATNEAFKTSSAFYEWMSS